MANALLVAREVGPGLVDLLAKYGLTLISVEDIQSPLGGIVYRCMLSVQDAQGLPARISDGTQSFIRVMDRFLIPNPPDPAASTGLFDTIAPHYESYISLTRNRANIRRLLDVILARWTHAVCVLDFGCGTGLSIDVVTEMQRFGIGPIDLVGTDASQSMLEFARLRGLRTTTLAEWRNLTQSRFHGIIASYVIHGGVTDEEFRLIHDQLLPRGVFVANFHHGEPRGIEDIIGQSRKASLSTYVLEEIGPGWQSDPVLVFERKV